MDECDAQKRSGDDLLVLTDDNVVIKTVAVFVRGDGFWVLECVCYRNLVARNRLLPFFPLFCVWMKDGYFRSEFSR